MRLDQITEAPELPSNLNAAKVALIKKKIEELENRISNLEMVRKQVRQITQEIKYDDTVNGIVARVTLLAEKMGLDKRSFDYNVTKVFESQSYLESAVFNLVEEFTQSIDDLEMQVENLRDQLDFPDV